MVLSRCAADGDGTGGCVVDVGDRPDARTADTLIGALTIGVTGDDGDCRTDVGLGQCVRAGRGPTNVDAISLPLVADRAEAIFVSQRVAGG